MSKDNLFLGYARGSVGDVVFSRSNGVQIARARNRSPRNPRSPLQLLQRVVMKTTMTAYSLLQDITNHSFQGYAEGTESQGRFAVLNVAIFRERLAPYINSGDPSEITGCLETNFSTRDTELAEINPYLVSEGTIKPLNYAWIESQFGLELSQVDGNFDLANATYKDVCDALGLIDGDQLTFLALGTDDTEEGSMSRFNSFNYGRLILMPGSGDMTTKFIYNGELNDPNPRNMGLLGVSLSAGPVGSAHPFMLPILPGVVTDAGNVNSVAGFAVIASRLVGQVWQRSTQSLLIRSDSLADTGHLEWDHHEDYMADAIASYLSASGSSLYLNQAGPVPGVRSAASDPTRELYVRVYNSNSYIVDGLGKTIVDNSAPLELTAGTGTVSYRNRLPQPPGWGTSSVSVSDSSTTVIGQYTIAMSQGEGTITPVPPAYPG